MSNPLTLPTAFAGLRAAGLAGLACLLIAGCGGDGDSAGPGPGVAPGVVAADGTAPAQTAVSVPPAKACDAAQGADLPPLLNTQLDCAP